MEKEEGREILYRCNLCCVSAKSLHSCLPDCDAIDCSLPVSLSRGLFRREYWSGLPCPSVGDLPDLGFKPMSLMSPALAGGFFTISATWEAPQM